MQPSLRLTTCQGIVAQSLRLSAYKPVVPKPVMVPFALSLSKGRSWFDKLTTNGIGSRSGEPLCHSLRHISTEKCSAEMCSWTKWLPKLPF